MNLDKLRAQARARSNDHCEWPRCQNYGEQLAHLTHRGMGGSDSANHPSNVMWLCTQHHNLLDGRTHAGLRQAMLDCLRESLTYRLYIGRLLEGKDTNCDDEQTPRPAEP